MLRRPDARGPWLALLLFLGGSSACAVEDGEASGDGSDGGGSGGDGGGGPGGGSVGDNGVPIDGLPTYDERLMLVAINRARAEPNDVAAGTADACSETKEAVPPVVLDHDATQAAHFHSLHLGLNSGGLSHASFCTLRDDLEAAACDGTADCSCVADTECWSCDTLGGCGTGPDGRMALFGFTGAPAGEVGAAGYGDGWSAVSGWVTENPCTSNTLAHRDTVTGSGANVVGVGGYAGGGCWGSYQFADFGVIDGLDIPALASGIHVPQQGGEGTPFTFYANYYHPDGAPSAIHVVVGGACEALELTLGQAGNGLYQWQGVVPSGCVEYYFVATDAGGRHANYPARGAFLVSAGATCESDYADTTQTATCR